MAENIKVPTSTKVRGKKRTSRDSASAVDLTEAGLDTLAIELGIDFTVLTGHMQGNTTEVNHGHHR